MNFVFLPLETTEKSLDAFVLAVAINREALFRVGEIAPGHVEPDRARLRGAFQLREAASIMGLAPRLGMAPPAMDFASSGTTSARSSSITLPKP